MIMRIHSIAILVFALTCSINVLPQSTAMTPEKWREDLRHMAKEVPAMHKDLFHKISKAEWDRAVQELDAKIPTLADHEVVVEMMRIIAKVGDGHTGVRAAPFIFAKGVYPVHFYQFDDGLYVRRAGAGFTAINGGKVVAIDETPVDEVWKRVTEIVWRDNEQGLKDIGAWLLSSPQVLHALRISKSVDSTKVTVAKNGKNVTAELKPTAAADDLRITSTNFLDSRDSSKPTPLWLKDTGSNLWFEYVPASKLLYVRYGAVRNNPDETVEAFFDRAFEFAEKSPAEKLVLDMRLNGGGNNYLNKPLTIGAIKSRFNQPGKFFVIIGRETFSAAQNAVNDLEKYTNAIFVGEPTAASPNHFGDARPVTLPNSKLGIQASTLWWQDKDPRDRRKWKAPDVAADLTFEDYKNARDPAIEAILNYKPAMSLDAIMSDARSTGDLTTFAKRLKEFKANPVHRYAEVESRINDAGYFLLNQNRTDDAIAVFRLNVELHPDSANVYDSLGEALLKKGDKANALVNYRKALELDPSMPTAIEAVKTLSN